MVTKPKKKARDINNDRTKRVFGKLLFVHIEYTAQQRGINTHRKGSRNILMPKSTFLI